MDRRSLSLLERPQALGLRRVVWPVLTSVFLLTGFASRPGTRDQIVAAGQFSDQHVRNAIPAIAADVGPEWLAKIPSVSKSAFHVTTRPAIDWANFRERVGDFDDASANSVRLSPPRTAMDAGREEGSRGQSIDPRSPDVRRGVYSSISVFYTDEHVLDSGANPAVEQVKADASNAAARSDLLSDIPPDYAALALEIAEEEGVDPNWVLSIMRAENADFDPRRISSAGAIGLMQVMPRIGIAFGAVDLTEPDQNIRAGTRFLRVLIDKYRNPVLIASAYNAGEPRVDAHRSLPLIQETADYVTRVVGFYTGTAGPSSASSRSQLGTTVAAANARAGRADRARSPMLVFSVSAHPDAAPQLHDTAGQQQGGGPLKIVKEEESP